MAHRFTIDGNPQLETSLGAFQQEVCAEVFKIIPRDTIESILLGGGYGRGEGGVLQVDGDEWPYNDFEYYLFVRGNVPLAQKRYHSLLANMGHRLGERWNMHVDFKITSISRLAGQSVSMFSYDLLERHYCVTGRDTPFSGCRHHHRADQIPLGEATRLMFNRCTGLLFSDQKLAGKTPTEEDIDFVTRNQAKAYLALGDSLLCAHQQYHWSCRVRHKRLLRMKEVDKKLDLRKIRAWHEEGLAFKLRPQKQIHSLETLRQRQIELTKVSGNIWLWIENKRLGSNNASLKHYASERLNKFPDASNVKNALLHFKSFGLGWPWSMRYPRERLYHALAWLLWEKESPENLHKANQALRASSIDREALIKRYEQLWERFG